jgi:hypothetical protein
LYNLTALSLFIMIRDAGLAQSHTS